MIACHDMPFGAQLLPTGGARFSLWAPAPVDIALIHHGADGPMRHAAPADARGWRQVTAGSARAGDRYQWAITRADGELHVPDPASRRQPDGVIEAAELVDPRSFQWEPGWTGRPWHEVVLYELHVGTFTPEGTFLAVIDHLDRLAALGVTAIELMPVATFPGRFGWGYDGVLPYAPHPAYGPPDDLKRLVAAAHARGLMVFLDVVYNHFGPDGNFLKAYAPAFFTDRHHNAWGDAINFDDPDSTPVREFFIHNALYWLAEFQIDGLRLDAVHAMRDDGTPHILEALSQRVRDTFPDRHVHLVLENDTNEARRLPGRPTGGAYDGQWNGDFHHTLHVLLTGEHEGYYGEYVDAPLRQLSRVLAHGFAREGEPHVGSTERLAANPRRDATGSVPLPATVNFLQNHDQVGNRAFGERLPALAPTAPRRLATALLLLCPPTPLLFMGEEWDSQAPFLYFADWQGDLRQAVTEGRRREFAHFAAFSDPAARADIPDPCDIGTFTQCKLPQPRPQDAAAEDAWRHHQSLLALRHRDLVPRLPGLRTGQHESQVLDGNVLSVRWHFDGNETLELVANVSGTPVDRVEPDVAGASTWFTLGEVSASHLSAWSARWRWVGGTR